MLICFTRISAVSFPLRPQCAGIHCNSTSHSSLRLCSAEYIWFRSFSLFSCNDWRTLGASVKIITFFLVLASSCKDIAASSISASIYCWIKSIQSGNVRFLRFTELYINNCSTILLHFLLTHQYIPLSRVAPDIVCQWDS